MGSAIGWVAGKVIDRQIAADRVLDGATGETTDRKRVRLEMENKKRTLQNCNETKKSAKHEHEELRKILKFKEKTIG